MPNGTPASCLAECFFVFEVQPRSKIAQELFRRSIQSHYLGVRVCDDAAEEDMDVLGRRQGACLPRFCEPHPPLYPLGGGGGQQEKYALFLFRHTEFGLPLLGQCRVTRTKHEQCPKTWCYIFARGSPCIIKPDLTLAAMRMCLVLNLTNVKQGDVEHKR